MKIVTQIEIAEHIDADDIESMANALSEVLAEGRRRFPGATLNQLGLGITYDPNYMQDKITLTMTRTEETNS